MTMLTVVYKCHCMPSERSVQVRERLENEDVVTWVRNIMGIAIQNDHTQNSPLCQRKTMEYVKIPIEEGQNIGNKNPRN